MMSNNEKPLIAQTRKERLVELIYRPNDKGQAVKAWFLGFGHDSHLGTNEELYTKTCAIVEFPGGHVELVDLNSIRFLT